MDRSNKIQSKRRILSSQKTNTSNATRRMKQNVTISNTSEKFQDKNTLSVILMKGNERWRFQWKPGQELEAVEAITAIAKTSDTNFDWFDAAIICHEMSKISSKAA